MSGPVFRTTRWRTGYRVDDVDDFLADVLPRVTDRPDSALAERIVQARFATVHLGAGYDMSDVDAYLDDLVGRVGGPPAPGA
ncbi:MULTISPECIES: DivIVA domain-containing protein [unclassified Aeromicrobium]|uniref:DivIVA domain-containing protein n=1 Tax=unclassified Aeromicrobium TaxID=2633570 RepID=UPI000A6837B5|nr:MULTISPECIES: DivIVA domain-containing protein [unclassified Aeromicrobium]